MNDVLFLEVQQFRQVWLWGIVIVVFAGTAIASFFIAGRLKHPKNPAPRWSFFSMVTATVVTAFVVALLAVSELRTTVKRDGIYVQYFPLHLEVRKIDIGELASAKATTYSPLLDYGGWGIRWGKKGQAYNVSGNRGVMLNFADPSRKPLLIGSNQAEALEAAIAELLVPQSQAE